MSPQISRLFGRRAPSRQAQAAEAIAAAHALDAQDRHDAAVEALRRAAELGSSAAAFELGTRLLVGRQAPLAPDEGTTLVQRAEAEGDAGATALLATLTAAGGLVPQDWSRSFDLLQRAAERGSASASGQLAVLAGDRALADLARSGGEAAPDLFARLRQSIDFQAWATAPAKRKVWEAPRIRTAEGVAPHDMCDWIIAGAKSRLNAALMYDGPARRSLWSASRTCSEYAFDIVTADVVMLVLRARLGALTGLATGAMEPPQVFHYALGQEIRAHYDHVDRGRGHGREGAFTSERVVSCLVYLNDDFAGGELEFPKVGFHHKGAKGDAVFFANVDVENKPDPLSLHAGLPITRGEKWLLSQWVHDQPFRSLL